MFQDGDVTHAISATMAKECSILSLSPSSSSAAPVMLTPAKVQRCEQIVPADLAHAN